MIVYRFMPKAEVTLMGYPAWRGYWRTAVGGGQSIIFAWSLNYFHYDEIYGPVGAVVAVLTWSYVSELDTVVRGSADCRFPS